MQKIKMKQLEDEFNILSTLKQWSNTENLFLKEEGSGGLKRKPLLSKAEEVGRAAPGVGELQKIFLKVGFLKRDSF